MMKAPQGVMKQRWIIMATLLLFGAGLFASGFWLGKHSNLEQTKVAQTIAHPHQAPIGLAGPAINVSPNGAPSPQQLAEFQQRNADLIKRQNELGQAIPHQPVQSVPPAPPPLQIPPNASPQLKTFLTDRDKLMREKIAFMEGHRADDPTQRQQEMQQWRQQNASRIQQLQLEAKALQQSQHSVSSAPSIPPAAQGSSPR